MVFIPVPAPSAGRLRRRAVLCTPHPEATKERDIQESQEHLQLIDFLWPFPALQSCSSSCPHQHSTAKPPPPNGFSCIQVGNLSSDQADGEQQGSLGLLRLEECWPLHGWGNELCPVPSSCFPLCWCFGELSALLVLDPLLTGCGG